ncbi:MAG: hypothetical protein IAB08_00830 [Bacteroidetes bacterium]|uniref:Uncharacterized protein n=1 Tax=Candidatus Pullibacteroides excrementavium TaxID=2840905 RepID=A0A9D9H193_9BACT|nr:hypothetical protein [Candidatus Pullibacteroides excrementavium]
MGKLNNYAGLFGLAAVALLVYGLFFANSGTTTSTEGSFIGRRGGRRR